MINHMHTVINEPTWGILVSVYYFLVAVSSGTIIVALANEFCPRKVASYPLKKASLLSLFALALAPIVLIAELLQPMRFLKLINPANFNVTSPLSWGVLILTAYGISLLMYILKNGWLTSAQTPAVQETAATIEGSSQTLTMFLLAAAIVLAFLPPFELLVVSAKVFWRSEILSVYFVTTTLLAGCAVLALLDSKGGQSENARNLVMGMKGLIILSGIWIIIRSISLSYGGMEDIMAFKLWWANSAFTVGEIAVGLVAPFVLLTMSNSQNSYRFLKLAAILALVGVFAMRYVVIVVGNAAIIP